VRYDAVKRIPFFENFVPQIPEKYCIQPTTPRKSREIYTVRYDAVKRIPFFENFVPQIPEKYCIQPTTPRK